MKLKHLLALVVAAVSTTGAWAQTDVTGTYLTDASFESADAATANVTTTKAGNYAKVKNWTVSGSKTDNAKDAFSCSAVFSYGSDYTLNSVKAPTAGPNGETEGKALGISMGWVGIVTFEQEAKAALPKGKYTLTYYTYNNNSEATRTSLHVGFVETGGTEHLETITAIAYGSWIKQTVSFDIESETSGKFTIIAKSNQNASSNKEAKFFIDGIKLEYAKDDLEVAKMELQNTIDAAPAVHTANVGTEAFQYNVTAYTAALDAARAVCNAADATLASITDAKSALETAIEAYNNLSINEPAADQLFKILRSGNNPMTLVQANVDGGYQLTYSFASNDNLVQAFAFEKTDGNNFRIKMIDDEGKVRYVTDAKTGFGNGAGHAIRTIGDDDMNKVAAFEIRPTSEKGKYYIWNNVSKEYVSISGGNVYCNSTATQFEFSETQKPSVAVNTTAAGWGTLMLPFAVAELPADVKAYTCAAVNGATLTLVEATAFEANKPYIIEGAWETTLTGDAQGTALTYTEGLLTGTYADMDAINGTYIMQKHEGTVGFYQVDTESAEPNVPANRAYLTVPDAGVKAFVLGEDIAVAIQSVFDGLVKGQAYDLAGRKVSHFQRGDVYIVNGKKVMVNK